MDLLSRTPKTVFTARETPLGDDPLSLTIDKPLIINVAPTGSFLTREEAPHQPLTPTQIVNAVIASYRAGASVWHVHCRDEEGVASGDPDLIQQTIDRVLARCPDLNTSLNVIADVTKPVGVAQIDPLAGPLSARGLKYIQAAVVPPISRKRGVVTKAGLQEIVAYYLDKGIRPEFQIHNNDALSNVVNWLIKPGILKEPYVMNIIMGHHGWAYSGPDRDPWGYLYLITMMNMMPPGSIIGVTAGGHNWMPMTMAGILLGADMVRIGTEDTLWMYPHKLEMNADCEEMVKRIATFCGLIGRDVATPADAKRILALP